VGSDDGREVPLAEQILECRRFAVEAIRRAELQMDPAVKALCLSLGSAWSAVGDELQALVPPLPPMTPENRKTRIGQLRARAHVARELARAAPDDEMPAVLKRYAERLEEEALRLELGGKPGI
jgi:hypothetical protein